MNAVRIGIGGPVGAGKTALVERLTRTFYGAYEMAVVTNDIFTREDAEFLVKNGILEEARIIWCGDGRMSAYGDSRGCDDEFTGDRRFGGTVSGLRTRVC